jgi:hypothetical protein
VKKTLLFAFIAIVFYTACTRISTTEIGTGLIPAVDGVNTFETTLNVIANNVPVDSVRISKYQEHALGYISNDPIFGTTEARINLELKPQYFPQSFEVRQDSLFLDSAVLVLKYVDYWGDSTLPVSFNVFELGSKMKYDSTYTNSSTFGTQGPQLNVSRSFYIPDLNNTGTPADTNAAFKEPRVNQIRIPLTTAFGNKLLHTFDTLSSSPNNAYYSDSVFSERFHGFSIRPNTSSNALLRISIQDTNTKLALYYRYKNRATGTDTVVRYFRAGFTAGSSNNIVRTRSIEAGWNTGLNNNNPKDSLLYLQSGPGHRISIKIPGLDTLSNRVVHRAELYMEQADGTPTFDDIFTPPNLFLSAYSLDSNRRFNVPNDIAYSSDGTISNIGSFGGYIIYKTNSLGKRVATYAFNVSRYVQGIATRKEKYYDFSLFAPVYDHVFTTETSGLLYPIYTDQLNPPGIGRVRLYGGSINHPSKMKLRIIYSKL